MLKEKIWNIGFMENALDAVLQPFYNPFYLIPTCASIELISPSLYLFIIPFLIEW